MRRLDPILILSEMATRAALGFRLHAGWAVVVAVAAERSRLEVSLRRRIELLPPGDTVPRFVFHKASELGASEAAALVRRAEAAAQETARSVISEIVYHLRSLDFTIRAAGVASGSKPMPEELSAVLASHPLIHTAEAALFRQAVASACKVCKLDVVSVREREIWHNAALSRGLKETQLREQIDGLRKALGAPWGGDQKMATAIALCALGPDGA